MQQPYSRNFPDYQHNKGLAYIMHIYLFVAFFRLTYLTARVN